MRILITGGTGYVGAELCRRASDGEHDVVATSGQRLGAAPGVEWHQLDVRDRAAVRACVERIRPDAIVHTAYRQDEWATTADGAAHVAIAAVAAGARLVHVSSDVVFSGAAAEYDEYAVPDPITPYGAAKAAAETVVAAVDPSAVIARTSLVLGDGHSSHELFLHDLVAGRRSGFLFTDQIRCPVHVGDLASALLELAAGERAGVHHLAGADAVSRYELGALIAGRDGLHLPEHLGVERPPGAVGPLRLVLSSVRTQNFLVTRLRGARAFLRPPVFTARG